MVERKMILNIIITVHPVILNLPVSDLTSLNIPLFDLFVAGSSKKGKWIGASLFYG